MGWFLLLLLFFFFFFFFILLLVLFLCDWVNYFYPIYLISVMVLTASARYYLFFFFFFFHIFQKMQCCRSNYSGLCLFCFINFPFSFHFPQGRPTNCGESNPRVFPLARIPRRSHRYWRWGVFQTDCASSSHRGWVLEGRGVFWMNIILSRLSAWWCRRLRPDTTFLFFFLIAI